LLRKRKLVFCAENPLWNSVMNFKFKLIVYGLKIVTEIGNLHTWTFLLHYVHMQEAKVAQFYKFSKYFSCSFHLETFLHLSEVTVRQTVWNVWLHSLPLYKLLRARQTTSYYAIPYTLIWSTAFTYPELSKKTIDDESVIVWLWLSQWPPCLLILQGKPCWLHWNSSLIEFHTFGLSSDLIILNSKFTYFGLRR